MYATVWQKFLPVIRIMIKKSIAADQVIKMNRYDFDRAGGGKKIAFSFTLVFTNGQVTNRYTSLIAKELVPLMMADKALMATLSGRKFELEMNPRCELSIRYIAEPVTTGAEEDSNQD